MVQGKADDGSLWYKKADDESLWYRERLTNESLWYGERLMMGH